MKTFYKPITCKLTHPELQQRKATVIADLRTLTKFREELPNGFAYGFHANDDVLNKLMTFIKFERVCCDFFTFELVIKEAETLFKITGPEAAKEFLKNELDL